MEQANLKNQCRNFKGQKFRGRDILSTNWKDNETAISTAIKMQVF